MKKSLLVLSIAAILAASTAFAAYDNSDDLNTGTNDDAVDKQTVTVTVPQVALLDVIDATTSNTITVLDTDTGVPLNAGDGFTVSKTLGTTYKLSSNVDASGAKSRKLTAQLDATLPENWQLSATVTKPDGAAGTKTAFNGTTSVELVTGIGNVRTTSAQAITYTLEPSSTNAMMAYATNKAVTITYTLAPDA